MSLIRRRMLWLSAAAAGLLADGCRRARNRLLAPAAACPARRPARAAPPRTPGAARCLCLYRLAARRRDGQHQSRQGLVRHAQLRRRAGRRDHEEHRPPSPADRCAAAAAGPADPERPQPSAFRAGPDRDRDRTAARHAHAAIADGRCRPCATRPAGDVQTHHDPRARGSGAPARAYSRLSPGRAPP